jgi:hypothetical protein
MMGIVTTDNLPEHTASGFQQMARSILEPHSEPVSLEWMSSASGTDALRPEIRRYAPRVDIALGPYNTTPGPGPIQEDQIWSRMRPWFRDLIGNPNPRCLIAIEVVYSGSAKHILGDILNASALGLYGLVVCKDEIQAKVMRNREYLRALAGVGKLPVLFQNVVVISVSEFIGTLR